MDVRVVTTATALGLAWPAAGNTRLLTILATSGVIEKPINAKLATPLTAMLTVQNTLIMVAVSPSTGLIIKAAAPATNMLATAIDRKC